MALHNFNCFAHSAASFIFIFACAYYTNPFDRQSKVHPPPPPPAAQALSIMPKFYYALC